MAPSTSALSQLHDFVPYQVCESGWPDTIAVQTGLGKTPCLDIAVWALAAQASLPPEGRRAARRTWYVVNRRLLVDAAYLHGLALQKWLADPALLREDDQVAEPTTMSMPSGPWGGHCAV